MEQHVPPPGDHHEQAYSCSQSATAIAMVREALGEEGVAAMLTLAGTARTLEELEDIGGWIAQDEMLALWHAGGELLGDPDFPLAAGRQAVARLGHSATSMLLRSLGSPEQLLRALPVASARFAAISAIEVPLAEPGRAQVRMQASRGYAPTREHCAWVRGMLSQVTALFGLPNADVIQLSCECDGDEACVYDVRWVVFADPALEIASLQSQLAAMSERLEDVFGTAADLISTDDVAEILAKITDRAARQVRAPRFLLAVRPAPGEPAMWHEKGFAAGEAACAVERALDATAEHPPNWHVAVVRSHRFHYGSLVAVCAEGHSFLPGERQLLDVYARYAASALDSASAISEARRLQREAQERMLETKSLLGLARSLASAKGSDEVAHRLAGTIPTVIDCDRVSVLLRDDDANRLVRRAVFATNEDTLQSGPGELAPDVIGTLEALAAQGPEPVFIAEGAGALGRILRTQGIAAAVVIPVLGGDEEPLGTLVLSTVDRAERLADTPELRDRLSGVVVHAVQALQNGRLVDRVSHQATHDALTKLLNRAGFAQHMAALGEDPEEGSITLFYLDLDGFKPVNDEHGHDIGDDLLEAVAGRLTARVRSEDVVARLGGDEFAVLVRADDESEVDAVAERLEGAFARPFAVSGMRLELGASIGRATWPGDVELPAELMRRADAAMYAVKNERRAAAPTG